MKLIHVNITNYGLDIVSYFGEIYIATQTIALLTAIVVVLRVAKLIRGRK